jgi:hypothetical protein
VLEIKSFPPKVMIVKSKLEKYDTLPYYAYVYINGKQENGTAGINISNLVKMGN